MNKRQRSRKMAQRYHHNVIEQRRKRGVNIPHLETMTRDQLLDVARRSGIRGVSSLRKAGLIERIRSFRRVDS